MQSHYSASRSGCFILTCAFVQSIIVIVHLKVIGHVEMVDSKRGVLPEVSFVFSWYIFPDDFQIVVSVRPALEANFDLPIILIKFYF